MCRGGTGCVSAIAFFDLPCNSQKLHGKFILYCPTILHRLSKIFTLLEFVILFNSL